MDFSRVEDTHFPKIRHLRVGDKLLDLSTPKIMGVVNLTPDSFFSSSRVEDESNLIETVRGMISEGADIIDIGGYSTRPGADPVSEEEEIKRVLPAVTAVKKAFPKIILSVDTFRSSVAEQAIALGADMINDISGWQFDPTLVDVVAKHKVPYILMHVEGTADTMHSTRSHEHFFRDVVHYFSAKLQELKEKGITDILIDPGFGFSKSMEENYFLMQHLEMLHLLERPLLVGISRKSMIWKKLKITPDQALNGTTILNTQAIIKGASIIRVHDVREAKQILTLLK